MTRKVERPRKFRCLFTNCKRRFGSDSDRQRHERIHTGEKPFLCNICYKGFPQRTGLKTHLNIHTGLKPNVCGYCAQAFADPSSKARHEKETHRCVGTYKCPAHDCPVGIKRRSAFVVHLKEKHNLDKEMVDIDACAPPLLPKAPRKERTHKKSSTNPAAVATSNVSARPDADHTSQSALLMATHRPAQSISLPTAHLFHTSGGLSPKHEGAEAKEHHWLDEQPRVKGESWDLQGVGTTFGYGDPELVYQSAPSYPTATSGIPDTAQSFPYTSQFSGMHPDAYSVHSTPENSTPPHHNFSLSPDCSAAVPRYQFSTRLSMPGSHLVSSAMMGSRPLSPLPGMHMTYFDGPSANPYHHKASYNLSTYEGARNTRNLVADLIPKLRSNSSFSPF